jgi:hypothetical protein
MPYKNVKRDRVCSSLVLAAKRSSAAEILENEEERLTSLSHNFLSTMNGPMFGNIGGGGGASGMADPQTMAAVKNVSFTGQPSMGRSVNSSLTSNYSRHRAWLILYIDAKPNGVLPCEDGNLRDNGICAWGGIWTFHGICMLINLLCVEMKIS